jgi:hypothetical protein
MRYLRLTAYSDVPVSRGVTNEKSSSTGSNTPRTSASSTAPAATDVTGTTRANIACIRRSKPADWALPIAIT